MYNQGNYQQFGQRLPAVPPPPPFQQAAAPPYGPPVSVPPSGMLTSSQPYLIPPPSLQNSNWSQSQHILPPIPASVNHLTPRIPPPHPHGQHYYRVSPPLPPPPTSSYFTPTHFGSLVQPPHDSSLGQLPPPPPPPSSPPPGPPPLPPSSPPGPSVINMVTSGETDNNLNCKDINGSETSVKDTPDNNIASDIPPPPPRPRDEKTVRKIEVLCQYIAKNGPKFEDMTCQKEVGNPEFEFLFGGVPGSEAAISHEYFKWMKKKCCSGELREGRHDKYISSKPSVLGTAHEDMAHSPAGSDMDMEDDITQAEVPGIVKSFESEKYEPAFTSNEVDIKVEEHVCDSKNISHKDATDGKVYFSDTSRVAEQGPNLSQDSMQFEKSMLKVGVADSEWSLFRKTDQNNVNLHQELNQSGTSAATKDSPFRLIQGYASDDSPESDNDPHLENISPEAVSPHVKENDIEAKNSSELDTGVGPLSLNIASKIPESSTKIKDLENKIDKQNLLLKGNDVADPKIVGARKEDSNVKLEVDEFGRMVKKGGSDSDSDDYYARRRGRRGRSRSRSRSRSPNRRRRWRDKRSRSRSWSPKKRSRSRSPYRRNRSHREICHDFRRGKCFRGTTCRYIHESDKSEEFRHHKNKQHYHEVSDRLKISDKLVPEKNDVGSQEMQELYQDVSRSSDRVNEEFVEPPGHSAEVASSHETLDVNKLVSGIPSHSASAENYPVYQAPSSSEHSRLSVPLASLWNSLPPPPPRPQLGGPLPLYQQNQLPFQTNYPFQAFVTPYGPEMTTQSGMYPMSYPMLQRPGDPGIFGEKNFAQIPSPNLISSNSRDPPAGTIQSCSAENMPPSSEGHAYMSRYAMQNHVADSVSDFGRSRISSHYNPYASTFDQPLGSKFSSGVLNQDTATSYSNKYGPSVDQNRTPDEGQMRSFACNQPRSAGDQYDPLFDSIEPSSNSFKKIDHGNNKEVATAASEENDEFGETADAEVGAVENDSPSPSSPIDLHDVATGEIEIDQLKDSGKTNKSKDSRSMKLFKIALADFVKEVLKPSWRQGNMSKEAFKTIVKKTVDKVSGAMKKHQIPKSQAKINHYIDSSQRKLTKLVMGYVDKYVKV